MQKFQLSGDNLTIELAKMIADGFYEISLSVDAKKRINASRKIVEKWIREHKLVFGVTTGIGEFKDVIIPQKNIEKFQHHLIISNCTAIGEPLSKDIVRLMLLLRINSLAKGYSGVRVELVEWLIRIFNLGIVPYIPSQGSVGISGDIVPLAHLAAFIIGEGFVFDENGKVRRSKTMFKKYNIKPLKLGAKEGFALITGTQMMTSYAVEIVNRASKLSKLADIAGALTLEALGGTPSAFENELQKARPHKGQIKSASNLRKLLNGSEISLSSAGSGNVGNIYSLRCMPQVHGAVKDTIDYAYGVVNIEINSVTDSLLVSPESEEHIEGGNFYGEPIALVMDYLKIALSELGNISERRIAKLVDSNLSEPPKFLAHHGGLSSGLMLEQFSAAALVSENKILSHPSSIDSVPSSTSHEDLNSFGSISSSRCLDVLNNAEKIIAIELLCSCQGIDFLKPLKCGKGTSAAYRRIREMVAFNEYDVNLNEYIRQITDTVFEPGFIPYIESKSGKLE